MDSILRSAKALVAIAAPLAAAFVTEAAAELTTLTTSLIAAGAAGILVWITPNKDT